MVCVALLLIACGKKEATPQGTNQTKQQGAGPTSSTATNALLLPLHFEHHTGDLDEMVERWSTSRQMRRSFLEYWHRQVAICSSLSTPGSLYISGKS
jgi:hypothetical protein